MLEDLHSTVGGLADRLEATRPRGFRGYEAGVADNGNPIVRKCLDRSEGTGAIDAIAAGLRGPLGRALVIL